MYKKIKVSVFTVALVLLTALAAGQSMAAEKSIGLPHEKNGMEIAGVYLQPIEMEPSSGMHSMRDRKDSDIHIEADIHASEGNKNGFAAGEWVPYLYIEYTLIKIKTGEKIKGKMGAMVASDGPHYGDNVKMLGAGKYKAIFKIHNPESNGFGRHTDRETGVAKWYKPFEVEWEFNYLGAGKKGGY